MVNVAPLRAGDPARVGGYRLLGRLGQGGQGSVYLAESEAGLRVAVKALSATAIADPVARRRFAGEVTAARQVSSFCIAEVLDADLDGDQPYIVSEFVDGPSLQAAVEADGPRTGGALHRLAVGTVTALAAIHRAGVVHRDVKPHNVVLGPDGPRVVDFGIARQVDVTATVSGEIIGSVAYMSPEQLGGGEIGPASDLFSWALTMAYAASGEPLFGRGSVSAIVGRIVYEEPTLPAMPAELATILRACLAKDPVRRPSAGEVLFRLIGDDDPAALAPTTGAGTPEAGDRNAGTGTPRAETPTGAAVPSAGPDTSATRTQPPSPPPSPDAAETRPLPGRDAARTRPLPDRHAGADQRSDQRPGPPVWWRRRALVGLAAGAALIVAAVGVTLVLRPGSEDPGADPGTSEPDDMVFRDDFSYQGDWDGYRFNPDAPADERNDQGYEIDRGVYSIQADSTDPNNTSLSPVPEKNRPGGPLLDVVVEVTAVVRPPSGETGEFGVLCRMDEDIPQGYALLLGLDGTPRIVRTVDGGPRDLTPSARPRTPPRAGRAVRIRAECRRVEGGTRLTMWLDGERVLTLTDPTPVPESRQSQVGLVVRSPESGPGVVRVSFDDFTVHRAD